MSGGRFPHEEMIGPFIEAEFRQSFKHDQMICGDSYLLKRISQDNRTIAVLSDGLGSGIKANVLATLTASMALSFISSSRDITSTAETIMRTLPVCRERRISYSTFTIADIDSSGKTRIIEYDNPPFILIRGQRVITPEVKTIGLKYKKNKKNSLRYSEFDAMLGDRLVFFSDGVSQSGIGSPQYPTGWGIKNIEDFLLKTIAAKPGISARELSALVVNRACANDGYRPKDDTSCGVIYFRKPRRLLLVTGPPVEPSSDEKMARMLSEFDGRKVICGGSTAKLISRELGRKLKIDSSERDGHLPPCSSMEGVDLVTEGTLTMGKILSTLETGTHQSLSGYNAVTRAMELLLDSDIIYFLAGTKMNEAYQDPNLPIELGLRRNLVKNIARQLEEKYLKKTYIQFI